MLEVCCGITNRREKDGGVRGPIGLWSEGPRVTGAPACAKYLSVALLESLVIRVVLILSIVCVRIVWESFSPRIGRERIPFYRWRGRPYKWERESLHMLLSLVAHAIGYNDDCRRPQHCLCQTHVGGFTVFSMYGKWWHPQHFWCPEACGGFYRVRLVWELRSPITL